MEQSDIIYILTFSVSDDYYSKTKWATSYTNGCRRNREIKGIFLLINDSLKGGRALGQDDGFVYCHIKI